MAPLLPPDAFRVLLIVTCPLILWIVWNKELWIKEGQRTTARRNRFEWLRLIVVGVLCGFYDGSWGPGGGTFMFLGLLFVVQMPVVGALAASKVANALSALVSLVSYSTQGYVRPLIGLQVAMGMAMGAFVGAQLASQHTAKIVRPVLAVVTILLLAKILFAS